MWAMSLITYVSNLGWGKRFLSTVKHPDLLWGLPTLLFDGYWGFFQGIKWPGHEIDHSPPSSAEVKDEWSCISAAPLCLHDMDRNNLSHSIGPLCVMSTSSMIIMPSDNIELQFTENW